MPLSPEQLFSQLVLCLLEFLEAAVHTTLWSRKLYPQELFQRKKFCGFNARVSRHPGLNAYISSVISNIKASGPAWICMHASTCTHAKGQDGLPEGPRCRIAPSSPCYSSAACLPSAE
jgi:hypothetical protein